MRKHVLWGHHVSEYLEMFDLSEEMLTQSVLEYGCGASAVNAALYAEKHQNMVSIDPLFKYSKPDLQQEIMRVFDERAAEVLAHPSQFNVTSYGGMDAFLNSRRDGISLFLADYEQGVLEGRYRPLLEDRDNAILGFDAMDDFMFDWALSSQYLFAGSHDQSVDFHLKTMIELARVAKEVRIFPLIERGGEPSALLGPVLLGLQQANFGAEVREVRCALYPKGNAMLRVWAQECGV